MPVTQTVDRATMNGWKGIRKTQRDWERYRGKKNSRAAKTILCNILLLLSLLLCIGRDNSCYEYAMKFNNSSRLMLSFRIRHTFSYLVVLLIFLASDGDKYTVWMIIWAAVSFDSFVWALPIIKCKYFWRILPRSHFKEYQNVGSFSICMCACVCVCVLCFHISSIIQKPTWEMLRNLLDCKTLLAKYWLVHGKIRTKTTNSINPISCLCS